MMNLTKKANGSNENTTEERNETVDIIESALESAMEESTRQVEATQVEQPTRAYRLLINADWDFASTVEDDRAMLQEVYTMIAERSEMVDELELVTAGHERGSANMIEHIAKAAAANHENVTHRVVLPYKEGETNYDRNAVYRRNRFLARYCDTALLFKASSEESRMSHHMERCFNEWKPATRNWEAKPVVVKTRNS